MQSEKFCVDDGEDTVFDYVLDFDTNVREGFVKLRPEAASCPPRFSHSPRAADKPDIWII